MLKKVSKWSVICVIYILFAGCEKDIYGTEYQDRILVKKTTFIDFEKNISLKNYQNVNSKIKFLNEVMLKNNKLVSNTILQKYFDDKNGIEIEVDHQKTFIFPIIPDNKNEKVKNLIFTKKLDGSYSTLIAEYNFTATQYNADTENKLVSSSYEINEIIESLDGVYSQQARCYATIEAILNPRDSGAEGPNTHYILVLHGCGGGEGSGSGSGTSTGSSGGSGNGSGSSGGNDSGSGGGSGTNGGAGTSSGGAGGGLGPIVIAPVVPPGPPLTPCQTLAEAINGTGLVGQAINDLKPATNSVTEKAVRIERRASPIDGEQKMSPFPIQGQDFSTNVTTGGRTIGQAHAHPITSQSIPSFGDLNWLQGCEDNISSVCTGMAFNIIVVKDRSNPTNTIIYAITISNFALLTQSIQAAIAADPKINVLTDKEEQIKKMNYKMGLNFADIQNNPNEMEKKFLQIYSNFGINFSKFDQNQRTWNNLKLLNPFNPQNPNAANVVISEPCN